MQVKELGHVVLFVTDLARSRAFYKYTLGFPEIAHQHGMALFSSGRTHHELLLIEVGGSPEVRRAGVPQAGLYHIGLKIGDSPKDLKAAYKELKAKGVSIVGEADHGVTHSLYILDPDGNKLELYADVSDAWKKDPKAVLTPPKALDLE